MAGTMDFDFRKRCAAVVPEDGDMPEHQIVIYGLTAREVGDVILPVFDLPTPYAELSRGGRRPGGAKTVSKHFFNKRIRINDGENLGDDVAAAVSHCGNDNSVGASDQGGSAKGTEEIEAAAECDGRSDPSTGEEGDLI